MVLESEVDKSIEGEIKEFKKCRRLWKLLTMDEETFNILEEANKVSIVRMGFNDHGRTHAKIVLLNALRIYKILESRGFKGNTITDEIGDGEDVRIALMLGAYLHDTGMCISRKAHDMLGVIVSKEIVTRLLNELYEKELGKLTRLKSIILECILCHLGAYTSTSLESKIIATSDGTDMTKGRARVPYRLAKPDIHKFSALSIESVEITKGIGRPIRIIVEMNDTTGIFQIETQLMQKIRDTAFADFVEIVAKIKDGREFSYW